MNFRIEFEQEQDGRWIAEVLDIPGVAVYGKTREEAMLKAQSLALHLLAERIDLGEVPSMPLTISFLPDSHPHYHATKQSTLTVTDSPETSCVNSAGISLHF